MIGVERGDLARLQDHGAAGREGGADLAGDLVQRPVPRRDQPDDADRLLDDQRAALAVLEREAGQHFGDLLQMRKADADLALECERARGSHLARHRKGEVGLARLVHVDDAAQEIEPLGRIGEAERLKGTFSGRDGLVHVGLAAERDLRERVLVRRIDDIEGVGHDRVHPGSVDVELEIVGHRESSCDGFWRGARYSAGYDAVAALARPQRRRRRRDYGVDPCGARAHCRCPQRTRGSLPTGPFVGGSPASNDCHDAERRISAGRILMYQQALDQVSKQVLIRDGYDNFIGGKWVAPVEGRYFDNPSPITGHKLCEVPRSSAADIELALDAAHKAKDAWGKTSPAERAQGPEQDRRCSRAEARPRRPRRDARQRQADP